MASPVHGLRRAGRKIVAVETAHGDIGADAVVLAAGMGSRALLRPLGQDVPLYPLKGYSLSVPLAPDDNRSEEHTSELQSLMRISYAVFCLKKNNTYENPINTKCTDDTTQDEN